VSFRAVIFDWRGTLVSTLSQRRWIEEALTLLGRESHPESVDEILSSIVGADGPQHRLEAPGIDTNAMLHRRAVLAVFADAGLDQQLAEALYAVESDPRHNPFADDVLPTRTALHRAGRRMAILSDIHFDLRPAFDAAGMRGLIDVFMLSFEQGLEKSHPALFMRTLDALDVGSNESLMVGDRPHPDGRAVEHGIATLLLPPLRDRSERRLRHVLALADGSPLFRSHVRSRAG
jgi:FMN phosphatase YigB (HAD superfamily)